MQISLHGISQARTLLAEHGEVRSQLVSDWSGTVPLPAAIADFYKQVGPVDITIEGYGNPYFLPSLEKLWNFQAGYRWNGLTGEPIPDWKADWFVVADEGGDPFIFDRTSSKVLFAQHGQGIWEPEERFPDLPTMAACLSVLGAVVRAAGKRFTDVDCVVRPEYREDAIRRITEIIGSRPAAEAVVGDAGWA